MGTTSTPNYGLIKPDGSEPATNWPSQNGTNMDTVDGTLHSHEATQWADRSEDQLLGPSNDTYAAGSPVLGFVFTAVGTRMRVNITGNIQSDQNQHALYLSWELRTGGVVGSGTIERSASDLRALVTSRAVSTGSPAILGAGWSQIITGLVHGQVYNIRAMQRVDDGGGGKVNQSYLDVSDET